MQDDVRKKDRLKQTIVPDTVWCHMGARAQEQGNTVAR